MGLTCSSIKAEDDVLLNEHHQHEVCEEYYPSSISAASSIARTKKKLPKYPGQTHLLYKRNRSAPAEVFGSNGGGNTTTSSVKTRTKLLVRTVPPNPSEVGEPTPGISGTHIYAVRERAQEEAIMMVNQECAQRPQAAAEEPAVEVKQEQRPTTITPKLPPPTSFPSTVKSCPSHMADMEPGEMFRRKTINTTECEKITDWVCVSPELNIYICDTGLTYHDCNALVATTEYVCRGQYAAYTYAKQTLGCRDHPALARTCFTPVLKVTRAIQERLLPKEEVEMCSDELIIEAKNKEDEKKSVDLNDDEGEEVTTDADKVDSTGGAVTATSSPKTEPSQLAGPQPKLLQLDDREPHIVKYDLSKRERQKLDMHTDKSEWTFLIALSDFCDYEEGGTYFEGLDASVHIQRGHALIFPGKLRHCGIRIKKGLRFLLVGFLVDKNAPPANSKAPAKQQAPAKNGKDTGTGGAPVAIATKIGTGEDDGDEGKTA